MRLHPCLLFLLLPLPAWSVAAAAQAEKEDEKPKIQASAAVRAVQPVKPATTTEPAKPVNAAALQTRVNPRLQPQAVAPQGAFQRELGQPGGMRFEQLQAMRRAAERTAGGPRAQAVTRLAPHNKRDYVAFPGDCNDRDPGVNPRQGEICNFKDDNCDGDVDEGVAWTVWRDADGDGFGDPRHPVLTCPVGEALADVSLNNRDCDDSDRGRNPTLGTCP